MESEHELSAEILVTRARRGCRDSFGVLAERHAKGVYNFLLQRTGSREDSDELSQETFLRAWRKLATYRDEWSFSTWVYSIARSVAADRARRARPLDSSEHAAESVGVEDAPGELDASEERSNVWQLARDVLDLQQHSALWLFYAEDRTAKEIGLILDRTPLAVRLLLFRARSTLRGHLERQGARTERRIARELEPRMESTP